MPTPAKTVTVEYYAKLREEAGVSKEVINTFARSAQDLFQELKARHNITLPQNILKIAINNEFSPWTKELSNGDRIVIIPPVSGG